MNLTKNIDLSKLSTILESIHEPLENILADNEKKTKLLQSMAENKSIKLKNT